jgi:hypothetical protein
MLNPSVDKFTVEFGSSFFNNEITQKYNDYLFHMNGPIKNIKDHFNESIQLLSIPGFNLNITQIQGLSNLKNANFQAIGKKPTNFPHTSINRQYAGNSNQNDILDSQTINVTFRNTLLNWMYIYEVFYNYYLRSRTLIEFQIVITLHDAADIPLMQFIFKDCFTSVIPGLEFAFNAQFRESKTIDASFAFNALESKFMIPEFNILKS